MGRPTHITMPILRETTVGLGDGDSEVQEIETIVTVSGDWCRAEPDVGIDHDWIDDLVAVGPDGAEVKLTPRETEDAQIAMCERVAEERIEAQERRDEMRRDAMMEDRHG